MTRRAPWLGLFAQQIIRIMLLNIAISVASIVTLFMVVDLVETGNFASDQATAADLLFLELYNIPGIVLQIGGIAALIGTLAALGALMRRLEIAAIFAAGAPPSAILKPVLIAGLGVAGAHAALTEWVVPKSRIAVSMLRRELGIPTGSSDLMQNRRTWFRGKNLIYRVESIEDQSGGVLAGVLMLRLDGGRVLDRWDIDHMKYEEGRWIGEGVVHRSFPERDGLSTRRVFKEELELSETPGDFVLSIGAPDGMSFGALKNAIDARDRLGQPSTAHTIEFHRRYAMPGTLVLMIALGAALALRLGRRGASLALLLGIGSAIGFGAWLLDEVGLALGMAGALPAGLTANLTLLATLAASGFAWTTVFFRGIR